MAERKRIAEPDTNVIALPETLRIWVPSGSLMSDLVLGGVDRNGIQRGGAYPLGTIINLVGDRSSGKTLLAIEALANFVATIGDVKHAKYADAESAFDIEYGQVLGMPKGVQTCPDGLDTVEAFYNDLTAFLATIPPNTPSIYILDSLDALSDTAEMKRDLDEGSYGANKAKQMSQLFRRMVGDLARKNCLLIIISQVREKIGVVFGEKTTRAGGKALDFFASQIIWLAEVGKIKKTTLGVERVIGIESKIRTKKNKVALAFRDCELTIIFNYGIDDEISMVRWLADVKAQAELPEGYRDLKQLEVSIAAARKAHDRALLAGIREVLADACTRHWARVEERLAPPMRKYGE